MYPTVKRLIYVTFIGIFSLMLFSCDSSTPTEIKERPLDTKRFESVDGLSMKIERKNQVRDWNLTTGDHLRAVYEHYDKDFIFVKMENGQKAKIHFEILSDKDKNYVRLLEKENGQFRDDQIRRERQQEEALLKQLDQKNQIGQSGDIVVLAFYRNKEPNCQKMMPHINEFASSNPNIRMIYIDVDKDRQKVNEFRITAIPTLIFIKNKQVVKQVIGFHNTNKLKEILKQVQ